MERTIRTVRRNGREYRAVVEGAKSCRVYTLGNYFKGEDCNPLALCGYMTEAGRLSMLKTKLTSKAANAYTLHVHSNCWFEIKT